MKAIDMYTLIQESQACEGLEEWLTDYLLPRMRSSSELRVNVPYNSVTWDRASFIRDMQNLGYTIDYDCDDRPCALPFYTISLVFLKSRH